MKLDPARWPSSWVPAVPALIMALVVVSAITGALHGTVGGVLVAVWFGVFGAIIWRADGIAWRDIVIGGQRRVIADSGDIPAR
jgi:hypothetical protein